MQTTQQNINQLIAERRALYSEEQWRQFSDLSKKINEGQAVLQETLQYLKETRRAAEQIARRGGATEEKIPVFDRVWELYSLLAALQASLQTERGELRRLRESVGDVDAPLEQQGAFAVRDSDDTAIDQALEDAYAYDEDGSDALGERISEAMRQKYGVDPRCDTCHAQMVLKVITKKDGSETVVWSCPNYNQNNKAIHQLKFASDEFGNWGTKPVNIVRLLDRMKVRKEEADDRRTNLCGKHPLKEMNDDRSDVGTEYSSFCLVDGRQEGVRDYLFQTLALPGELFDNGSFKDLGAYSRFRLLTVAPCRPVDTKTHTIYALALRLAARGIMVPTYKKTETALQQMFFTEFRYTQADALNKYVHYRHPVMAYDSQREQHFAETYFPQLFGEDWASYVYSQMPLPLIANNQRRFVDQRVDFYVVRGDRRVVIELDGEEHGEAQAFDATRDAAIKRAGCEVIRFSNREIDHHDATILERLQKLFPDDEEMHAVLPVGEKFFVACKVVHQVVIALLKALEAGHLSARADCTLKMDTALFSAKEQETLLLLAIREVTDLIDHFSLLYGAAIDVRLTDPDASSFTIYIGDGEMSPAALMIRDVSLTSYHFCQLNPFVGAPLPCNVTLENVEFFLYYIWGYPHFRWGQYEAVQRTLLQRDSIVLLPTGSGKSIIFQLSALLLPGITMVISPLKALIVDQLNNLRGKGIDIAAARFSGDQEFARDLGKRNAALFDSHSAAMYYIAPERLVIPAFRKEIAALQENENFTFIAFDEAHCVSEWGHDFRPAYLLAGKTCRELFQERGRPLPFLALTGTASDRVLKDMCRDLGVASPDAVLAPPEFDRPELHYLAIRSATGKADDKPALLENLLKIELPRKFRCSADQMRKCHGKDTCCGIIFTTAIKTANALYHKLREDTPRRADSGVYYSTPPSYFKDRKDGKTWEDIIRQNASRFSSNRASLLIATKAFGMGIDKPNIRYIIHYDIPASIEQYYQEVGRAGRDRQAGYCALIVPNITQSDISAALKTNLPYNEWIQQREYKTGDLKSQIRFHLNNFQGTDREERISNALIDCIFNRGTVLLPGTRISIRADDVKKYMPGQGERKRSDDPNNTLDDEIKKLAVRLIHVGALNSAEYDYCKEEHYLTIGDLRREALIENYKAFVGRYDEGRVATEGLKLSRLPEQNKRDFLRNVLREYIQFVYDIIESGRRQAIRHMFELAIHAADRPISMQDEYIRTQIQDYLAVKNAITEKIVNNQTGKCGLDTIEETFPFALNGVFLGGNRGEDERLLAIRTKTHVARHIESHPFHPGLLFLRAIASVKSNEYNERDVVNDASAAYQNARKMYGISTEYLNMFSMKVVNLFYNASPGMAYALLEQMWKFDDLAGEAKNVVQDRYRAVLKSPDICIECKDYLLLQFAADELQKLIGEK